MYFILSHFWQTIGPLIIFLDMYYILLSFNRSFVLIMDASEVLLQSQVLALYDTYFILNLALFAHTSIHEIV